MANPITINPVALPNFDSALRLYQQSGQGYQDAFSKLTATATGAENALKAKHDAELQALINSAGSPAELASPEFQAKVQQAKDSMYGTFDPKALTSYLDSRPDTLITRDNNVLQNTLNRLNVADTTRKSEMLWNTQDAIKALGINPSMQSVQEYLGNNPNVDAGSLLSTFANGRSLQDAQTKSNVDSQTRQLAQFALSGGQLTQEVLSQFPDADLTAVQAAMDNHAKAQWDLAAKEAEVKAATRENQTQETLAGIAGLNKPPSPGQFTSEMGNLPNPAGYDDFVKSSVVTRDLPVFSKNIAPYENAIMDLSKEFSIPPALIMSMIWKESLGNPKAESSSGAYGLMQLIKGTARDMKVDRYDPVQNLRGGVKYMRMLLDRYDNNVERALAAYNAGMWAIEEAERKTGSIYNTKNKKEVSDYVPAVLKRFRYLSSMQGGGMGAIVPGSTGPRINPNNIGVVGGRLTLDAAGQIPAGTSSSDIAALANAGLVPDGTGGVGGSGGGQSRGQIKGIGTDVLSTARLDLNKALTNLQIAYEAGKLKPLAASAKSWGELHLKEGDGWLNSNAQSQMLEQLIKQDSKASTLPEGSQIALAERILSRSRAGSTTGTADWFPGRKDNQDAYKRMLQEELASATAGSAEGYEQNRLNAIRAGVNALQIKVRSVNPTVSYSQIADTLDITDKDQLALGYISKDEYERRIKGKTPAAAVGGTGAGKKGESGKPPAANGVLKKDPGMNYPLVKLKGPEVPIPPSMFLGNVGNGGQLPGVESTMGPGGLKFFKLDANQPTAGYQSSFLSIADGVPVAPRPINLRDPNASGHMTIAQLEEQAANMRLAIQVEGGIPVMNGFGKPRLIFSDPAMASTVAEHERGIAALQAVGKHKEAQQLDAKLQGIIQRYRAEIQAKERIFSQAARAQRAAVAAQAAADASKQQNMDASAALKLLQR